MGNQPPQKKRTQKELSLLDDVRSKKIKEETLAEKLRDYIEQQDMTAALEQVTSQGAARPRQDVFISPLNEAAGMAPELHHPNFVLRLHKSALTPP